MQEKQVSGCRLQVSGYELRVKKQNTRKGARNKFQSAGLPVFRSAGLPVGQSGEDTK